MNPKNFENPADDDQPAFADESAASDEGPLSEVTQKVAAAAAGASEKFSKASDSIKESYRHTSERVSAMRDEGLEIIRQNPASSILGAFVLGAIVGYSLGFSARNS